MVDEASSLHFLCKRVCAMEKKEMIIEKKLPQIVKTNLVFEYFWNLPKNWFEPPNHRRGGWSGVIKHTLPSNQDITVPVFVKLQSNSVCKSIRHPFKGKPTFYREFINTQKAIKANVRALDFIYFAQRGLDVILVSKSLEGYRDLHATLEAVNEQPALRRKILDLLSDNLLAMHKAKIKHGALYKKHVLVKIDRHDIDIRFIDFEKSRKGRSVIDCIVRDIYTLFRHCGPLNDADHQFLMDKYHAICSPRQIKLIEKRLDKYKARKQKRSQKK